MPQLVGMAKIEVSVASCHVKRRVFILNQRRAGRCAIAFPQLRTQTEKEPIAYRDPTPVTNKRTQILSRSEFT